MRRDFSGPSRRNDGAAYQFCRVGNQNAVTAYRAKFYESHNYSKSRLLPPCSPAAMSSLFFIYDNLKEHHHDEVFRIRSNQRMALAQSQKCDSGIESIATATHATEKEKVRRTIAEADCPNAINATKIWFISATVIMTAIVEGVPLRIVPR